MLSSVSQMVNLIENGKWKMENCFVFLFPLPWGERKIIKPERVFTLSGHRLS